MNKLIFFICSFFLATLAHAGGAVQIYPLEVMLSPDKKTDSVTLANQGDNAIDIQVSAKSWDMDENGKFIETDIGDFVFFPRLLHIPAHEEKSVRIGYNGDFPAIEKSYRLILEELAPVKTPEQQAKDKVGVGINWLLRLSVPLFVMPSATIPDPSIKIEDIKKTDKGWSVAIANKGNYHVYLKKLSVDLMDSSNKSIASNDIKDAITRILPQRRINIDIPLDKQKCKSASAVNFSLKLETLSDVLPISQPIQNNDCTPSP